MHAPKGTSNAHRLQLNLQQRNRLILMATVLLGLGLMAVFVWPRLLTSPTAGVKPVALADIPGNIAKGQAAPDFTVRTMGGGQFALADHAGQPTLLMFGASWCSSCLYEAKNLAQVYAQYKDRGLNVIVLDTQAGDTDAELQNFREQAGNPDYVWAFDDNYALTQAFKVRSLDTTVLIDPSGKIVYEDEYPTPLEPLLQAAKAVLGG